MFKINEIIDNNQSIMNSTMINNDHKLFSMIHSKIEAETTVTIPMTLISVNWSKNEITFNIDNHITEIGQIYLQRFLGKNKIDNFDDIDVIVTLENQ